MMRRLKLLATPLAVGALALMAMPSASADAATLYSPKPVFGWGQDGTAYAVAIGGGNVFAGGAFNNALYKTQSTPRVNLMAVSASTGALSTTFRADTNGIVRALATDSNWLYVGGEFTNIGGVTVNRLARVDLATGAVDAGFTPNVPNTVRGLAIRGTDLYVVGDFGSINGTTRKYAAAISTDTGALEAFNPTLNGRAFAVSPTSDGTRVYLGGNFTTVAGTARTYLAAVDPSSGSVLGPSFTSVGDVILSVSPSDDGSQVFAAGGGKFNSAAAWSAATGKRQWSIKADGDMQAIKYSRGNVYFGFHDGYLGNTKLRLLAADPSGTLEPGFQPTSGGYPGVLAIAADGTTLAVAGKFPSMGGVNVKGVSVHH
jgi:hypothetical protein